LFPRSEHETDDGKRRGKNPDGFESLPKEYSSDQTGEERHGSDGEHSAQSDSSASGRTEEEWLKRCSADCHRPNTPPANYLAEISAMSTKER
jgi:hypothetical protein